MVRLLEEALRARGAALVSAAPGLAGCWRYQVQSQRWADGRSVPSNSRCVLEIGPGELRSHCPGQDRPAVHSWSPVDASHLALRPARTGAPRPPAAPLHAAWRVEGRWLRLATEQRPGKAGEAPKPFAMESVLIRTAPAADGACRPGAPSPLRTVKGAPSSVTFTPPEGWAPLLKDGADVPAAARLGGGGLLVAMLVPAAEAEAAAESAARASAFVVVVDDTSGPAPVLPEGFPAVKAALRKELGGLAEACDGPRTLCVDRPGAGDAAPASSGFVVAEGRLLVVHATAPAVEAAWRARDAVVARLLALEP